MASINNFYVFMKSMQNGTSYVNMHMNMHMNMAEYDYEYDYGCI